jgi:hypothetical protein
MQQNVGAQNDGKTVLVAREAAQQLSLARFRREYLKQGRPLLITGLEQRVTDPSPNAWTRAWLVATTGSKTVCVHQNNSNAKTTGRQEVDIMWIEELLGELEKRRVRRASRAAISDVAEAAEGGLYLYDVSLPKQLPAIVAHTCIPRYFCHDYLQRTMHKHTYSKSWPSFFIAEPGTCSSLHVDQVGFSRIAHACTRE